MSSTEQPPLREAHAPFSTFRAIFALMLREMSTTYGRSPGGYIWAILEPAAGIALLTAIFSAGFRTPPLGTSFSFFYAGGILPLLMYTDVSNKVGQTIQFNRALLAYPRITFIDALLARLFLNFMTQVMVHTVVLSFILLVLKPDTTLDFVKIGQAYVLCFLLAAGVGTLNSFLTLAYPVWQTAWAIMNRPLFLISCIFFVFEIVPEPYSDYLWYNPLVHIIGHMRDGYYPYYQPTYVSFVYPVMLSAIFCMAGLFLLNRYHRDILDK
ncbi:ABC transporter permease [Sulfitobacter aestuariivivens]|uniref:ABC transporter permease n=1 Tax=Sulfitobacter aestuariivivens TaxID=2766981 RepID=A0A927HG55_9RHOB|nr:ABC transporter permease [Sulfitobacter aestuariivivens]MBD3665153.1 ABC transporter permease [Sulfitobacter aestuariivivens]